MDDKSEGDHPRALGEQSPRSFIHMSPTERGGVQHPPQQERLQRVEEQLAALLLRWESEFSSSGGLQAEVTAVAATVSNLTRHVNLIDAELAMERKGREAILAELVQSRKVSDELALSLGRISQRLDEALTQTSHALQAVLRPDKDANIETVMSQVREAVDRADEAELSFRQAFCPVDQRLGAETPNFTGSIVPAGVSTSVLGLHCTPIVQTLNSPLTTPRVRTSLVGVSPAEGVAEVLVQRISTGNHTASSVHRTVVRTVSGPAMHLAPTQSVNRQVSVPERIDSTPMMSPLRGGRQNLTLPVASASQQGSLPAHVSIQQQRQAPAAGYSFPHSPTPTVGGGSVFPVATPNGPQMSQVSSSPNPGSVQFRGNPSGANVTVSLPMTSNSSPSWARPAAVGSLSGRSGRQV